MNRASQIVSSVDDERHNVVFDASESELLDAPDGQSTLQLSIHYATFRRAHGTGVQEEATVVAHLSMILSTIIRQYCSHCAFHCTQAHMTSTP